jgi:hypothetical protein
MGYSSVLYFSHITISLIKINIWNYSQRKKTHHNGNCIICKSVMDPSKKDEHSKHHKRYWTPEVADDSDGSRIWKKKKTWQIGRAHV